MRLAVLSSRFPFPLERGDKLRLFHQIKVLSQQHEIYLFSVCDKLPDQQDIDELRPYCKEIFLHKLSFLEKIFSLFYAVKYGWPLQTCLSFSTKFNAVFHRHSQSLGIDVVYCQLVRMAPYCYNTRLHKVLDYMDAFGIGMERRAKISHFPLNLAYLFESKRVKTYEKKMTKYFNAATIITKNDRSLLQIQEKCSFPIAIVSNGIDTSYFHPQVDKDKKYDIGFIGNLGYLPNVEAVRHLCQIILPLYFQKYNYMPSVLIAGARPDAEVLRWQSDHIEICGWIDDIRTAYREIKILCAPIWKGTGQQNKVMEALSSCIPVVCTEEVNKGIGAINHLHLLEAKNDEEMVDQIYQLLTNEAIYRKLASNGRAFVEAKFNWDNTTAILLDLLQTKDIV